MRVFQVAFRFLLQGIEFGLGQLHELIAAGLQRFAGERLKSIAQLELRFIQQFALLGKIGALRFGIGLRCGAKFLFVLNSFLRVPRFQLQRLDLLF